MGKLIDGQWSGDWYKSDDKGHFVREETKFRGAVSADGSTGYKAEAGRYHLYVSLACPWAHRTLIVRELKGLKEIISVSIVDPIMSNNGWRFIDAPGAIPDSVNNTE